jgi:hypothetical protein
MTYDPSNSPFMPPNPPVIYRTRPSGDWGTALVFACFALGLITSWGTYEMHQRVAQEEGVRRFRHDVDALVSQQSDLGHLLANPHTKVFRLHAIDASSPVVTAAVAWNNDTQTGAIFCDDLALQGSRRYQIQLIPAAGAPVTALLGPSIPGQTVYLFNPKPGNSASPEQIILCAWDEVFRQSGPALASGSIKNED